MSYIYDDNHSSGYLGGSWGGIVWFISIGISLGILISHFV